MPIGRNFLWNMVGHAAPLSAAVFSIPILLERLGLERFGFFTLALVVVGYFSIFDSGIARAMTRGIAESVQAGDSEKTVLVIWSGMALLGALGAVISIAVLLSARFLVAEVLTVSPPLRSEAVFAMQILSGTVVLVVVTAGFRGVLEGYFRFRAVSLIGATFGTMQFVGAALVVLQWPNLVAVVCVLVLVRFLSLVAYYQTAVKVAHAFRSRPRLDLETGRHLLMFGGLLAAGSLISPLMSYLDRLLVGAFFSLKAVAFYATPQEMIRRMLILPEALVSVLFPTFAAQRVSDYTELGRLFNRSVAATFLLMFLVAALLTTLAYELLSLWLGREFALNSYPAAQILAGGLLANSVARMGNTLLQAVGRPDLTVKVYMCEIPFYLLAIWLASTTGRIEAVAVVWSARMLADFIVFHYFASRMAGLAKCYWRALGTVLLGIACLIVLALQTDLVMRIIGMLATSVVCAICAWYLLLASDDRVAVYRWFWRIVPR